MTSAHDLPRCREWVPGPARGILCREVKKTTARESISEISSPIENVVGAQGVILMAAVFLVAMVSMVSQISTDDDMREASSPKKVSLALGFWSFAALFTVEMIMVGMRSASAPPEAADFGRAMVSAGAWGLLALITAAVVTKLCSGGES